MPKAKKKIAMLYDDRTDITHVQLERILQATLWLGDNIVVPAYARPSPVISDADRADVAAKLGALAEAGLLGSLGHRAEASST